MKEHLGAGIVGGITRRLPVRRWQASHWLGRVFAPRRPFVGRFLGGRIEVHPGEVASSSSFYTGFYEREPTIWCRELIRNNPPGLLVDVGANFGYYPLLFGLLTDGRTRSIAFEPEPRNFDWLCRNVALNSGLDVTTVRSAVGSRDDGAVVFETALEGHNLWSRVALNGAENEHSEGTIEVPVTRLDTYLDRNGIGDVSLTLIDVEGYEGEVLDGMSAGLKAQRYRRVLVEFHPWAFESAAAMEAIARRVVEAGYTGRRFRHVSTPDLDKSSSYFRLDFDPSILGPLTFDDLTSWEHYLFEVDPS